MTQELTDLLPNPHEEWGRRVLTRLNLHETDTVLDAGAGFGGETAAVLPRVPHGRVIAVDNSPWMIDQLAARFAGSDRVEVLNADLTRPLPLARPVDVIFSVSAFHWITDHDALFANLINHVRPGGQFVAECGGPENLAALAQAVEDVLGPAPGKWHFAGAEETAARLARAGFTDVEAELVTDTVHVESTERLERFLAGGALRAHLNRVPPEEHEAFIRDVAGRLGEPAVEYVRLVFSARRP
jgi:trans-aconitate 2-methyltransferase